MRSSTALSALVLVAGLSLAGCNNETPTPPVKVDQKAADNAKAGIDKTAADAKAAADKTAADAKAAADKAAADAKAGVDTKAATPAPEAPKP